MNWLQQFFLALSFFTRIPLPHKEGRLADAVWAFPVAGALIGLFIADVYLFGLRLGLPYDIAAWTALGLQLLLTGALHEDGLADCADALAGKDRAQKLTIMKDSRIGTYGVLALIVVMAVRAQAIQMFPDVVKTLAALVAAGACSRTAIAVMMYLLPPARADGLTVEAGKPSQRQLAAALIIAALTLLLLFHVKAIIIGLLTLVATYALIAHFTQKLFGGITGDVLGALQVLSETALLVTLSVCLHS